jgi:hypothetical protein
MARVVDRACNRLGFARNEDYLPDNPDFRAFADPCETFASATLQAVRPAVGASGKNGMACNAIL